MDIIAAYREAGTYRGAAEIAGTTPKTVKRVIARHGAGGAAPERAPRGHNYDGVAGLVAERVEKTAGRISAKRLLPAARAAGYAGSDRNFRRLVAAVKQAWRREHHRGRRPAVWSPGEHLVIDWDALAGLHVFCAVLAWSRFRFVRFAADERAETTLAMLGGVLRGHGRGTGEGPGGSDGAAGSCGRVVGEGDPAVAHVPDHILCSGLGPGVGSAARAQPAAGGGLGAGQQEVQHGEVRQDAVLPDAGVLRPGRIGRGGAGVAVAAPVGGIAVGPG
jgi:hypothetical protein